MKMHLLFRWYVMAAFVSLLFVFVIVTQSAAKDPYFGARGGVPAATVPNYSERGIIVVGGKARGTVNPGPTDSMRIKMSPQDPVKAKMLSPGSDVMLNPQPLPPKVKSKVFSSPGSDAMLNPQPLPPKEQTKMLDPSKVMSPGSDISLNPQPLPPKVKGKAYSSQGSEVMLNPQPLPPKIKVEQLVR